MRALGRTWLSAARTGWASASSSGDEEELVGRLQSTAMAHRALSSSSSSSGDMLQPVHFFAAGHLPHAVPCLFTTLIARGGRVS
jgi:hypothetical protein